MSADPLSTLTIAHVAELLDCSTDHVHALIESGLLRAVKVASPTAGRVTHRSRWRVFRASVAGYLGVSDAKSKPRRSASLQAEVALAAMP